jgi:O-antigen ligase
MMDSMNDGLAAATEKPQVRPWQTFVNSRRFAWIHLGCAMAAGAAWYISDGRAGPWPLLVALIPWAARAVSGQFPIPRTRLDPFILLFVVAAAAGVWAAYDQTAAVEKFWLILGSVFVFYALAGQRAANLWTLLTGISLFGGGVGLYFLLTHDWTEVPAKIEALNRLGLRLMGLRPAIFQNLHQLHPNVAGGIMALLTPYAIAAGVRALRKRHFLWALLIIDSLAIMALALALTTSRGAAVALVGGLVGWLMWIGAGYLSGSLFLSRRKTLGFAGLLLLGISLSAVLLSPGGLLGYLDRLPGPASAGSRLQLAQDALDLAGDYWLTGAGLNSFDGLYSQYILNIPLHAVIHSHNVFLNVVIEQGVLGFVSLVAMVALSFWWLSDPRRSNYRHSIHGFQLAAGATFAALIVICLHGLVDDPLYGSRGVLLLWLPAGITAMLFPLRQSWRETARSTELPALIGLGIVAVLSALLLLAFRSAVVSTWHSSMGALEMARVELANYPSGEWSDGREAAEMDSAVSRFNHALLYNRDNRTAWHRLGLIAMLNRDYESATDSLYYAYLLDRNHRGIRKSLAYAYVWTGDIEQSLPLLRSIPEASQELSVYSWWWRGQGHPDFAERAEAAQTALVEPDSRQ